MRPVSLRFHLLVILAFLSAIVVCSSGFYVSNNGVARFSDKQDDANIIRPKRELENLDEAESDVFQTTSPDQPDEPGFWDRVVKVALKLFSKFIEWLNS